MYCVHRFIITMAVELVKGDLLEIRGVEGIVHVVNCLCTKGHGLSLDIARKFPWGDIYSKRKPIKNRNLAVESDRGVPGTIRQYKCAFLTVPTIVCFLAQWDYGKADREYGRKIPPYEDSKIQRTVWFTKCLDQLGKTDLKSVAFPYKIGCGLGGQNWNEYYHLIEEFAKSTGKKF